MAWWWDRVVSPMRSAWISVAARLGMRKSGLRRLGEEVSTCEYEDVRVMWELLTADGRRPGRRPAAGKRKTSHVRATLGWAPRGAHFYLRPGL